MALPNLLKVAVIEGQKVFVLIVQTLNIMSDTLGEIPDISLLEFLSKESTIFVDTGEKKRSVVNETPFGL